MNANELADLLEVDSWYKLVTREEIATMLRQQADCIKELEAWQKHDIELAEAVGFERAHKLQAEKINNLEIWQKKYLDVIEAQKEYMKAQDEKIVDLAFKLVYAERSNEVFKELTK